MNHPKFKWGDEFERFLDSLSDKEGAKILSIIDKIEKTDRQTAVRQEWVKKPESNLYEVGASISSNALRGIYFQRKRK